MSRLPNFEYQYKLDYNSNFNNQLLRGHNQGLSLYDYENDTKLYQKTNTDLISTRNINFDKINQELDNKGDVYNQGKQLVNGIKDGINKISENTSENIKELFSKTTNDIKLIVGVVLFFLLLNKK